MMSSAGYTGIAEYTFHIDNATEDYRLHASNYVGGASVSPSGSTYQMLPEVGK
jgi:hypothetical protein